VVVDAAVVVVDPAVVVVGSAVVVVGSTVVVVVVVVVVVLVVVVGAGWHACHVPENDLSYAVALPVERFASITTDQVCGAV
jgi:hypothetical protein